MSTNVPPHNLGEVIDALSYMLDGWEQLDDITIADLMNYIRGPDFPTGALVFRYRGSSGDSQIDAISNAYATGRGRVIVRAKAHIEHMERNKSRIVITELPYQTNKTNLLAKIADFHRDGKIDGLTDLRDESDRNGMRIILETTRNVEPEKVLAELFRLTPMQNTFSIIMVALVNGEPRVITLKQALKLYLEHRLEVIQRRSDFELRNAKKRAHILEGLLLALNQLDAIIETIRRSRTVDTARNNLQREFKLSEIQAQAILDMPLRRLANLERRKLQDEYKEKLKLIRNLEDLLEDPAKQRQAVKLELLRIKDQYGDVRRTQIVDETGQAMEVSASDLLPDQICWVTVGEEGTIARTANPEVPSIPIKPDELPAIILQANTQDVLYLFTADGQAVSLPVYQLPQARTIGQGTHWANLTGLTKRNHVPAAVVHPAGLKGYLFLATLGGVVKRIRLEDLPGITSDPFVVMNVQDDDALGWAKLTTGEDEVILATALGQAIRFEESEVRAMGLPAGGVMGIKLASDIDGIVGLEVYKEDNYLWSITDNGLAKTTPIKSYPTQGRYGQGVINVRLPKESSEVVSVVVGEPGSDLYVITATESSRHMKLGNAATGNRPIKPRPVIRIGERNRVTGVVAPQSRPIVEDEPPDRE
jgi:DNA gyrase subunit A